MRTLGLIGGMSWQSTLNYYREINLAVEAELGGLHSAKIILHSVDFAQIEALQRSDNWTELGDILLNTALGLQSAGAQCIVICTNTMHKVADTIQQGCSLPLLHIADATGKELIGDNIKKVGLLGTRFTMEQDFYTSRLVEHFGIEVLTPNAIQRNTVHRIIYDELCIGKIRDESRTQYLAIIDDLVKQGAQAVILGCTEIGLLVNQQDTEVPLYDTTLIHAKAAVEFAVHRDQ
ncbi:aspartate/glutamate racemase family protein [Aliiglaciecola sp. LCG003]|uniref:aspartate/glutamate racemase family protein n=1 Tax=Aliiglaciecola sp. LCG003 TaxID=3053655 RepID=UPI0025739E61|nr:aspartate/glutamate racemase family protein [Aliiglaciecola sp. LCG003]WJG08001.1 aspartate/glutamate racemase family protein [Aliiglaciecola sp. LCG003]